MSTYYINKNTKIITNHLANGLLTTPIQKAVERFYRDMNVTLLESNEVGCNLVLSLKDGEAESYRIYGCEDGNVIIEGADELGIIYALLQLSETALGVFPFWFWNDQEFMQLKSVDILKEQQEICSKKAKVKYRGWFINDEVLLSTWKVNGNLSTAWEMAMEALLRLGGNMVIPGTDSNSKTYRKLATDMGLWITHHHAEPLGAEMFARAYPHLNPSYDEHPELFEKLWREGIESQLGDKVIWNLGFRGQGDLPFWLNDPKYATPKQRGELISKLIRLQYQMVCDRVKNPVCCTNLYGEIMELYQEGMLDFPEGIIKVWADNGYGKMVSRRQGNNNPRVPSLPSKTVEEPKGFSHGIYYHVSFYDLQAANHMTMLPNTMEFVGTELEKAFDLGVDEFLIVNCSNIKPHVYPLDYVSTLWRNGTEDAKNHRIQYVKQYYGSFVEEIAECFAEYPHCMVPFGRREDEHAGEQFYNYTVRQFVHQMRKGDQHSPVEGLLWLTLEEKSVSSMKEQVDNFYTLLTGAREKLLELEGKCEKIRTYFPAKESVGGALQLFMDSIWLQARLHLLCVEGGIAFCEGYQCYGREELKEAFFLMGLAADYFQEANDTLRAREHGKWLGFYANECLCDIKQTAYVLRQAMGYLRNLGDGPHFYGWQREVLYAEEDRRVVLLTNMENHLTDQELYEAMKKVCDKKYRR